MPLPAGRRQELAGLLLARAFARDPGGVASGFEDGFSVEEGVHCGLNSRDLMRRRERLSSHIFSRKCSPIYVGSSFDLKTH